MSWRQQRHQCLFSLLRFFYELFDGISDDPFLTWWKTPAFGTRDILFRSFVDRLLVCSVALAKSCFMTSKGNVSYSELAQCKLWMFQNQWNIKWNLVKIMISLCCLSFNAQVFCDIIFFSLDFSTLSANLTCSLILSILRKLNCNIYVECEQ